MKNKFSLSITKRCWPLVLLGAFFIPQILFAQAIKHEALWEKAAMGRLPGITHKIIQGWNPAITTTFEDVSPESSAIAIPVAALSTPYCASTDQTADITAGTGARTLSLTLVTTAYAEVSETVTLHASDGRTSVNLATANVLGINDLRVATAGSGGGNAGVIDCGTGANTAGSAAVAYATIGVFSATAIPAAGAGAANVAHVFQYIVPANKTLLCRNVQVGSVFATAASGIDAIIDGSTNLGLLKRFWVKMIHNTGGNPSVSPEILVFPEKTYLKGRLAGVTGSNTGPASMSMECLLVDLSTGAQGIF